MHSSPHILPFNFLALDENFKTTMNPDDRMMEHITKPPGFEIFEKNRI